MPTSSAVDLNAADVVGRELGERVTGGGDERSEVQRPMQAAASSQKWCCGRRPAIPCGPWQIHLWLIHLKAACPTGDQSITVSGNGKQPHPQPCPTTSSTCGSWGHHPAEWYQ